MDVSDKDNELKKIRIELQWLSWGLVKIPVVILVGFLGVQLISLLTSKPEEASGKSPASRLEAVCTIVDGRLAVDVGSRTLYIDPSSSYEELSETEKWRFWDQDGDGIATEEEIESGIMRLEKSNEE